MDRPIVLALIVVFFAIAPTHAGNRPCVDASECLPGWVCEFPLGDCARENGNCEQASSCDPNSGLVCGCPDTFGNSETFLSTCDAEAADAVVASLGACQIGASCGGQTCTGNTFCQLPPGECHRGLPDGCPIAYSGEIAEQQYEIAGICTPLPTSCSQVSEPVCACDGSTYLNSCEATRNFESIIRDGTCHNGICGGFIGISCNEPGDICVAPCFDCTLHNVGGCEPPPPAVCADSCAPVCGCGDVWYRNRCDWINSGFTYPNFPIALASPGGCGEVLGVQFMSKTDLYWRNFSAVDNNVYRASLPGGSPPSSWTCVAGGLTTYPHPVSSSPASGETWAFVVTKVEAGVEGPLGWGGSGCTERINTTPCPP